MTDKNTIPPHFSPHSRAAGGGFWDQQQPADGEAVIRITFWPHRSLGPRGFLLLMAGFGFLAFLLGCLFFYLGAWPVIGFMGLEIGLVWLAFRMNYRAGQHYEELLISPSGSQLARIDASGRAKITELASAWLRAEVIKDRHGRGRLYIRHHADQIEIGRFLPPDEKPGLASAINKGFETARLGASNHSGQHIIH